MAKGLKGSLVVHEAPGCLATNDPRIERSQRDAKKKKKEGGKEGGR